MFWDELAFRFSLLTGAGVVIALGCASSLGTPMLGWLLAVVLLGIAGVMWLVLAIAAVVRRRVRLPVLIAPLVIGLLAVTLRTDLPAAARFAVSKPFLDYYAAHVTPPPKAPLPEPSEEEIAAYFDSPMPGGCPGVLGLYLLSDCYVLAGGYVFLDGSGAFIDHSGLAYLPYGVPPYDVGNGSFEGPRFEHLGGDWYTFIASW